jgi:peptidoglycan lytic transglycosylase G
VVTRTPVTPPRPRRPRPSQRRLALRRTVAVVAVLAVLAALVVGAFALAHTLRGSGGGATQTLPPPPKPFKIVFPEGFTRRDMAKRITAVDKIAARERGVHPHLSARVYLRATQGRLRMSGFGPKRYPYEGFLFPATYDFLGATTSKQLVHAQLSAFGRNWSQVNLAYARSKNLTPYDVLIIASLVEKEALAPDERAKIARVIYNRLHAGMNLGIDASTRYGLGVPGTKSLTQSELNSDNPYNTRNPNIIGLPPTPIANPGLASMQAAAHPAPGDWLYFVRKPDKVHHFFTASYTAFQNYANTHGF